MCQSDLKILLRATECSDAARSAWKTAKAALDLFRSEGHLNNRSWAQARVAEALAALAGGAWTTVRNLLQARAAFTFLDCLHAQLSKLPISPELREALVHLWRLRHRSRGDGQGGEQAKSILVQPVSCAKLVPDWLHGTTRSPRYCVQRSGPAASSSALTVSCECISRGIET